MNIFVGNTHQNIRDDKETVELGSGGREKGATAILKRVLLEGLIETG